MAPSRDSPPTEVLRSALETPEPKPGLWTITDIPGKDKGVIASTDIAPGTLLISEPPILTTEIIRSVDTTESDLAEFLRNLPREQQRAFLSLHNNYPGQKNPLSNIVRSNGYPLGAGADVGGVFENISRVNHSCLPNAVHSWNPIFGEETVYAVRAIKKGEEITLSYHAGGPTEVRKRSLKEGFGFDCTCVLCDASEADMKASDERLSRVQELDDLIGDSSIVRNDPWKALAHCKEMIEILEIEGIKDDRLSRAYYDAFQVLAIHSDGARAAWWAKKYCEAKLVSAGKDSVDRLEMKPYAKRPQKHNCYGVDKIWKTKLEEFPKERSGPDFEKWLWRQ
jgi:hypothetical protein